MTPPTTRRQALRASLSTAVAVAGMSGVVGNASAQTTLTFDSTDLDSAVAETGVAHENVSNTDHNDSSVLRQGYSASNPAYSSSCTGYFPYDEDTGSTAYNMAGSSNGTINGATTGAAGLLGTTCYDFDGTDDYVDHPNTGPAPSETDSGFTLSMWLLFDSSNFGNTQTILSQSDGYNKLSSHRHEGTDIEFTVSGGSTSASWDNASAGVWYHVVGVYDGTDAHLYVDGTQRDSYSPSDPSESDNDYVVGRAPGGGNETDGRIGEVRMFDRGLTSSEMQRLYDVVDTAGELVTQPKVS